MPERTAEIQRSAPGRPHVALDIAVPGGDRQAMLVPRRAEGPPFHHQAAGPLVGIAIAIGSHDVALAGSAVRLDPKPEKDRSAARPAALNLIGEVAIGDATEQRRADRDPATSPARPATGS